MGYDDGFMGRERSGINSAAPAVGVFVDGLHARQLGMDARNLVKVMLAIRPIDEDKPIPASELVAVSVAVVQVNPVNSRSVDRLVELARSRPDLPVIAAITAPEMGLVRTLVREGVADVISLPIDPEDLAQVTLDALARRAAVARPVKLAPLIGVVRTNGGCGATTVATHLAAALANHEEGQRKVVLGDGDLQFGSIAAYLDANRSGSLFDLAAASGRLDAELLRTIAPETEHGLSVITAPAQIEPMDDTKGNAIFEALDVLRQHYDAVVVDFPTAWTNWSASLAYSATMMLVVSEVSLSSFRQARRCLELFDTLHIPRDRIEVVANKVERRAFRPLAIGDMARVLGKEPIAVLPDEEETLRRAQDQGVLADAIARKNPFSKAIGQLADDIALRIFDGTQL